MRYRILILILSAMVLGCSGSGPQTIVVQASTPITPVITSFTSDKTTVTRGHGATLTAVFSGGTALVGNGVGSVSTGVPVVAGPINADTTFILTVTGNTGLSVSQMLTIRVVDAPQISYFNVGSTNLTLGQGTILSYAFTGGTGSIQGLGPVTSPGSTNVAPNTTTTYTLSVVNSLNDAVTQMVTISVVPPPVAHPHITSFTANKTSVQSGQTVVFTPIFENGTGSINTLGTVQSNTSIQSPPIYKDTVFTLSVLGTNLETVTSVVTVTVLTGFQTSQPLNGSRTKHVSTVLKDGNILVAGGISSYNIMGQVLPSYSEVINTKDNSVTKVGSMLVPRLGFTSTLLNNGKVLITGGTDQSGSVLSSTELFDPNTGSFSAGTSLTKARASHTASLLSDGRVLILGGYNGGYLAPNSLSDGDIYDPVTNRVTPISHQMLVPRANHAVVTLNDGKILILGGDYISNGSYTRLNSTEIYDPATTGFNYSANMPYTVYGFKACLLQDGRVLVCGGQTDAGYGLSSSLYNPITGLFSSTGSLNVGRSAFSMSVLDNGKVLVSGGQGVASGTSTANYLATAEIWDPTTGLFTVDSRMPMRGYHSSINLRGRVYIIGGNDYRGSVGTYDGITSDVTIFYY